MKIFYIILLFFGLIISFLSTNVYGGFYPTATTLIDSSKTFSKVNGINTLKVKELVYVNDYAGSIIILSNGIYFVNGGFFGTTAPNQKRATYPISTKTYRYDTTKPYCGNVKIYEEGNESEIINLGEWTNRNIKAKIKCIDTYSGCSSEFSRELNVGYKTTPQTTFSDIAGNSNTCIANMKDSLNNKKLILVDKILPKIDTLKINGNDLLALEYKKDYLSDSNNKNFTIKILDTFNTTNGVSGIKKFNFTVKYLKNHNNITKNKTICSSTQTYPDYNKVENGTVKEINDVKGISINCESEENGVYEINKIGEYEIVLSVEDFAGNIKEVIKNITIYPGDLDATSTISTSINDKYSNNTDNYHYEITLKDKYLNPIYNKTVNNLFFNLSTGDKTLKYEDGGNSLIIYDKSLTSNLNGKISFKVKSLVPGEFTQKFKASMNKWGDDYADNSSIQEITLNGGNNTFQKPFIGEISIIGGDIPEIGKDQKYNITISNPGNLNSYSNGKLDITNGTIINIIDGHYWKTFEGINNRFWNNITTSSLGFSGSIDATDNILEGVKVSSQNIDISYIVGGKKIKYYLDDFELANSCSLETLGVKVYGIIQGDGKSNITGQEENFSALSKGKLRSIIRKDGYKLIRGMTDGDIVNGVKYIEGSDITIGGNNLGYETLIVKDGNIIINSDLNTDNKKLGIIILKDNYLIESDYNNVGNIYVNKDVETINAIIYADGAFRSAKSNGTSYSDEELNKQLTLYGTLFTRNTIGGAVKADTSWTLPGGQETDDYSLSEIYDLNYVRKVPLSCGTGTDNYSFIIKYNSSIQSNPPKGF